MWDLIRFVLRGALGGAIVPLLFAAYYMIFYDAFLIWYFLFLAVWALIPGAIVGAVLWFLCARFIDRLGPVARIPIGAAVASTSVALLWLYLFWIDSGESVHYDLLDFRKMIVTSVLNGTPPGGLAGWLCPSATVFRKEPKLTYWERVRAYEAAQAEHEYRKAQLDSEKLREQKRLV